MIRSSRCVASAPRAEPVETVFDKWGHSVPNTFAVPVYTSFAPSKIEYTSSALQLMPPLGMNDKNVAIRKNVSIALE